MNAPMYLTEVSQMEAEMIDYRQPETLHKATAPEPAMTDFFAGGHQVLGVLPFINVSSYPRLDSLSSSITHEVVDGDVTCLTMAVEAPIALLELGGVPGAVVVEQVPGGSLEVQALAAASVANRSRTAWAGSLKARLIRP